LKGENYDEWARSVRMALRARKKFGFIDGSIKKPMDDSMDLLQDCGPLIPYWCPGFESPLNISPLNDLTCSRSHKTYGMIFAIGFH